VLPANKEASDIGPLGTEYANSKESLGRHALGGVLARQPMPIVGQIF
jgi:hypothetical protein